MTLKNKLQRLKKHIVTENTTLKNETIDNHPLEYKDKKEQIIIPNIDQWFHFQATPFYFEDQYSLIREVSYPIHDRHGLHRFSELKEVIAQWKEKGLSHPLSYREQEPSHMIFLDTETTGLGGGVGNTIFLIGYAKVLSDRVVVKQHFLPNPSSEVAFYQGFLTDLGDYHAMKLTTYNGRAFDWPQIKTRHTFIRNEVPKLPSFGHFDLLHAARRLWKHKLPSVRLSIVEKEILNIQRDHDVPGYLAPMLYFDFLKSQDPQVLSGVFIHNEIDVLSLISLYIHISKKLLNSSSLSCTMDEKYEIARWFEAIGQTDIAIQRYEEILFVSPDSNKNGLAGKALAKLYKKQKRYEEAANIWTRILKNKDYIDVESAIELSKLYEHQWKDIEKALYYAKLGYQAWKEKKRILKTTGNQEKARFKKRIERLESKKKSNF